MNSDTCELGDGTICQNPKYDGCGNFLCCEEHCQCYKAHVVKGRIYRNKVDNLVAEKSEMVH